MEEAYYGRVHSTKDGARDVNVGKGSALAPPSVVVRNYRRKGPDGIGDYRPRSNYFPLYIGVGATSPEATSDLSYLCRAAPDAPPPVPRQSFVGEVGWGWQYNQLLNGDRLLSNMQIKKTDIRRTLEDKVTQKFQMNQRNIDDLEKVNTKFSKNN